MVRRFCERIDIVTKHVRFGKEYFNDVLGLTQSAKDVSHDVGGRTFVSLLADRSSH